MAKKATAEASTGSQAIRDYLAVNNDAGVKQIVSALAQEGIHVSESLASKVKYHRSGKKRGRKRGRSAASNGAEVNKSEEIRKSFKEMGIRTRPRDVLAALAERGITVSSAQVSTIRVNMKKANRARRNAARFTEAGPSTFAAPTKAAAAAEISGADLIEAKRLADQLGGVERMKAVLAVLDQLAS